jgi:hypothetical protein
MEQMNHLLASTGHRQGPTQDRQQASFPPNVSLSLLTPLALYSQLNNSNQTVKTFKLPVHIEHVRQSACIAATSQRHRTGQPANPELNLPASQPTLLNGQPASQPDLGLNSGGENNYRKTYRYFREGTERDREP